MVGGLEGGEKHVVCSRNKLSLSAERPTRYVVKRYRTESKTGKTNESIPPVICFKRIEKNSKELKLLERFGRKQFPDVFARTKITQVAEQDLQKLFFKPTASNEFSS